MKESRGKIRESRVKKILGKRFDKILIEDCRWSCDENTFTLRARPSGKSELLNEADLFAIVLQTAKVLACHLGKKIRPKRFRIAFQSYYPIRKVDRPRIVAEVNFDMSTIKVEIDATTKGHGLLFIRAEVEFGMNFRWDK